jgi:hypothetical protein
MEGVRARSEGIIYKDQRVMDFLVMKRENTIEQGIERQRYHMDSKTKDDKEKVCYLLTAQPISFKTKIVTKEELIRMLENRMDETERRIMEALKQKSACFEDLYKMVGGDRQKFVDRMRFLVGNRQIKAEKVNIGRGRPRIIYNI